MKRVKRPWGHYIIIHKSKNYLIKKIVILPNESISLQLHHHRSEHWIVINGIAKIQIGNKKIKLTQNQSTYVPVNKKHKVSNNSSEPLIILETQLGQKLSEKDIIRFEDQYNRS